MLGVPDLLFSWILMDTPLWYMKTGRAAEAEQSLRWLRGPSYQIEPELKELEDLLLNDGVKIKQTDLLMKRNFILPVLLQAGLFWIYAAVGVDTLTYYALMVFIFPGVSVSPSVIAILFQVNSELALIRY